MSRTDPSAMSGASALAAMFDDTDGHRRRWQLPTALTTDPQAEVLVFGEIDPRYISGVAAASGQLTSVRRALPERSTVPVTEEDRLFRPRLDYCAWQNQQAEGAW